MGILPINLGGVAVGVLYASMYKENAGFIRAILRTFCGRTKPSIIATTVPIIIVWDDTSSPYLLRQQDPKSWRSSLLPSLRRGGRRANGRHSLHRGTFPFCWRFFFQLTARGHSTPRVRKHELVFGIESSQRLQFPEPPTHRLRCEKKKVKGQTKVIQGSSSLATRNRLLKLKGLGVCFLNILVSHL